MKTKMKLFTRCGVPIVAKNLTDARRIAQEAYGERVHLVRRATRSIPICDGSVDGRIVMTRPSEVVKMFPRGIIPESD